MAEELFRQIDKQNILAVFAPEVPYCLGADGSQLRTRCRAIISFSIGPFPIQHSFLVLSKLRHPAILGSDFLEDKECNVDFPQRKLRFENGRHVDLHRPNKRVGQNMPVIMGSDPLELSDSANGYKRHNRHLRRQARRKKRKRKERRRERKLRKKKARRSRSEEEGPTSQESSTELEEDTPPSTSSTVTPLMSIKFPPGFKDPRTGKPIGPESPAPSTQPTETPLLSSSHQDDTEESTPWRIHRKRKNKTSQRAPVQITPPTPEEQRKERTALLEFVRERNRTPPAPQETPAVPVYNRFSPLYESSPEEGMDESPKPQRPPRVRRDRARQKAPSLDPLGAEEPTTRATPPTREPRNILLFTEKLDDSSGSGLELQWRERDKILKLMEEGIPPSRVEFIESPNWDGIELLNSPCEEEPSTPVTPEAGTPEKSPSPPEVQNMETPPEEDETPTTFSFPWNDPLNRPPTARDLEEDAGSAEPKPPDIGTDDPQMRQAIIELLKKNEHMFAPTDLQLGTTKLMEFPIETENVAPIKQKAYPCPWSQKKIIEEHIRNMLEAGVIRPSCSPWASPVLLVDKPVENGKRQYRFCVDFRKLNKVTKKNSAPLPNINDVLDSLQGSKVFSSLDLKSGYWQVPIREGDQEKTAFITHLGLFEFTKVAFGLCNAPSAFVTLMNAALGDIQYKYVLAYLDDLIIHSKTLEEHIVHLQEVFKRLEAAGLMLKPSKCRYLCPVLPFLGHIISADGVRVCPDKVAAIANLEPPETVKLVRGFIGMCSYYRKFIPNMAEIAKPLVRLTKKSVKFEWTEECQEAFNLLKQKLATAPVLAFPNPEHRFVLYTDASAHSIGAILAQIDDEGTERVVQYASQKLTPTQERWSASERECYAIVRAVNRFRQYLLGSEFTLYTDHKPLSSLFIASMKNTRIQRWATTLSEYDIKIEHKPGGQMRADFLSRIPAPEPQGGATEDDDRYLPEIHNLQPPALLLCDRCRDPLLLSTPPSVDGDPGNSFEFMAKSKRDWPLQLCPACEEDLHDYPQMWEYEQEEDPGEISSRNEIQDPVERPEDPSPEREEKELPLQHHHDPTWDHIYHRVDAMCAEASWSDTAEPYDSDRDADFEDSDWDGPLEFPAQTPETPENKGYEDSNEMPSALNPLEGEQPPQEKGPRLKLQQIHEYLRASAVTPTDPLGEEALVEQSQENRWADHPVWANYATQLDGSPLAFFLPSHYKALMILTRYAPPYTEAWTDSDSLCFYFVGTVPEERPFGPFWDAQCEDHFKSRQPEIPPDAYRLFKFGRAVQQDLDTQGREDQWERAYTESQNYLLLHRKYVRKAGRLLGVDMECHDLSKTRLLSTALAFLFHFGEDRTHAAPYEKELATLAWDAVHAGHLELENHHPEHQGAHPIDPLRMFVDRLSVRLQKHGYPGIDSWDLPLMYIPKEYQDQWQQFKAKHQHIDVYSHLCPPENAQPSTSTEETPNVELPGENPGSEDDPYTELPNISCIDIDQPG